MAFLQKRPQTGTVQQYYTLSGNKTILIVGLGNPGKEYDGTRHNIGFACLDHFASKAGLAWLEKKDMKTQLASGTLGDTRVICIKPTTFMNNSGEAVQAIAHFYKIPLQNIIVVHDEIDIPFGQIRLRVGGSAAGHNGIKSVSQHLGEAYGRVRVGIGPKAPAQIDSADFVLARFSKAEAKLLPALQIETTAILNEYIFGAGELPSETRSFLI